MPLAPGLLSITMPTPRAIPRCCEMIRVVVSVPLPAADGTTTAMVPFGYGALADAADDSPAKTSAEAAMARRRGVDSEIILFRLPGAILVDFLARTLARRKAKRKPIQRRSSHP